MPAVLYFMGLWDPCGKLGPALEAARASGDNTVIDLSDAEIAAFAEAVAAVTDAYVAEVDGEAALAAMKGE